MDLNLASTVLALMELMFYLANRPLALQYNVARTFKDPSSTFVQIRKSHPFSKSMRSVPGHVVTECSMGETLALICPLGQGLVWESTHNSMSLTTAEQ